MQVKINQVTMSLNCTCDALVGTIKSYLLLTFDSRGMVNLIFKALPDKYS